MCKPAGTTTPHPYVPILPVRTSIFPANNCQSDVRHAARQNKSENLHREIFNVHLPTRLPTTSANMAARRRHSSASRAKWIISSNRPKNNRWHFINQNKYRLLLPAIYLTPSITIIRLSDRHRLVKLASLLWLPGGGDDARGADKTFTAAAIVCPDWTVEGFVRCNGIREIY